MHRLHTPGLSLWPLQHPKPLSELTTHVWLRWMELMLRGVQQRMWRSEAATDARASSFPLPRLANASQTGLPAQRMSLAASVAAGERLRWQTQDSSASRGGWTEAPCCNKCASNCPQEAALVGHRAAMAAMRRSS